MRMWEFQPGDATRYVATMQELTPEQARHVGFGPGAKAVAWTFGTGAGPYSAGFLAVDQGYLAPGYYLENVVPTKHDDNYWTAMAGYWLFCHLSGRQAEDRFEPGMHTPTSMGWNLNWFEEPWLKEITAR